MWSFASNVPPSHNNGGQSVADELEGAILLDSGTRVTHWAGLMFVPVALWTPDDWSNGVPAEPLDSYSTDYLPTGNMPDGENELEFFNALWVRARLPYALGFAPPTCRRALRTRFLDAALLAVSLSRGRPRYTPFICADVDLQAELRFGRGCSPDHRRRKIAAAFWGLLASDPYALASYRDRFLDGGGHEATPSLVEYKNGLFHLGGCRW